MAALNNGSTTDNGHLIVELALASREEEEEQEEVQDQEQDTGAGVVSAVTTAGAGAVTTSCRDGGTVNTTGAVAAVITAGAGAGFVITTSGAGAVTNAGGTSGGGIAINTSGAGTVKTSGALRKSAAKCGDLEAEEEEEEDEGDDEQANGKLPWMVGVLGGLANGTATVAALYRSPRPRGGEVVYTLGIASVFAAGVGEMLAALWVSGDTRSRGPAGKRILCASLVTVLLGLALNGFAYLLRKKSSP